ncbi:hypothetical protein BD410DRAFT_645379 [Rickenella mellea]|uniref:Uncharacterized protein n=1 Tax=Rickenella mellea TaxID=50990 RepID=A0A4Y7PL77_9AGAM|nr:hypothetical protein BD410DRAFT_645379 [Rickenella mellea]
MLTDKCFRMQSSPKGLLDGQLSALFSIYTMVLYGVRSLPLSHNSRRHLHMRFTCGVHVYWGDLLQVSGCVAIPIEKYIVIINELALFVPEIARRSNVPTQYHYASNWDSDLPVESVEFQDASAVAIRKMIHCRTHECIRCGEFPITTKLDT